MLKSVRGGGVADLMRAYFRRLGTGHRDVESGQLVHTSRGGASSGSSADTGFSGRLVEETASILDANERNNAICFSCEIVKGVRVKHCPFCDRCVDRLDHHWCETLCAMSSPPDPCLWLLGFLVP